MEQGVFGICSNSLLGMVMVCYLFFLNVFFFSFFLSFFFSH